jgi:hypothetical protein
MCILGGSSRESRIEKNRRKRIRRIRRRIKEDEEKAIKRKRLV